MLDYLSWALPTNLSITLLMNKLLLLLITLFLIGGCTGRHDPYRLIGEKLKKQHNLTGGELIVTYDLGKIDRTNCIYAQDLGVIINNKKYPAQYVEKFNRNFKSPCVLRKEAMNKVARISKMLLKLHAKYHLLSNSKLQYVSKLAGSDLSKIDPRSELSRLNEILLFIPVMLPEYKSMVSSHYGDRLHPIKKQIKFHCGTDLVSVKGSPIFAAAKGKVIFAGKKNGYGHIVEIMHTNEIVTKYAHLDRIYVRTGQYLDRGKMIGNQGRTGDAIGHHLHFEIWIKGNHVDPYDFIGYACKCQKN
jgi:murein DD-endopeptidase MepM/ murein hydrolase activator NlpD